MILGSFWFTATSPIDPVAYRSKIGVNVVPPFTLFQTPPDAERDEHESGVRIQALDVDDAPAGAAWSDAAPDEVRQETVLTRGGVRAPGPPTRTR